MRVATVLVAVCMATPLSAQRVAGIGDDAIPIAPRTARLALSGVWDQWDQRLSPSGTRAPLLDALNGTALGTAQIPSLSAAESGIRQLLGDAPFTLSLGALEASGRVRRSSSVLQADFGITRRISVGVRVPYVEVVHDATLVLNRDGTGANVGANPALSSASVRTANGQLLTAIESARSQLQTRIAQCATAPSSAGCAPITANPGAAQALLERASTFSTAWSNVYGSGTRPGAPVVPIVGSATHGGILAALETLRTGFAAFGTSAAIPQTIPGGATLVYGTEGLQTIARDSAFGVLADTLAGTLRAGMGDVDVEARVLLYDRWKASQVARLTDGRSGVRVLASAGWRFGSASSAQDRQAFALATGDGVDALLLRATADAVWGKWAWVSATVRSMTPRPDQAVVRLPGPGDPSFFFASTPELVTRSLGSRLDIEVAPRLMLGEKLSLSGTFTQRTIQGDAYERVASASGTRSAAGQWETPSQTMQLAGVALTYSTLAAFVRGKSRFPVEVLLAHERVLSVSGAPTPALSRDRLEVRVYPRFPRR